MIGFRLIIILVLCRSMVFEQDAENVQLVGGTNQYSGRVEVRYGALWATVCDKFFDDMDARVICRSLGIRNVETIKVFKDHLYGQGTGPVITDLGCRGNETNPDQCSLAQWHVGTCKHTEDVGIHCQTPVFLVGSLHSNAGEVKVTVSGANYSVCSDVFGPREAEVTCRMLGFSTGNTSIQSLATSQSEAVSNISCNGQEFDLSDCGSSPLDTVRCSFVTHLECRTALRLVNGSTNHSGRVEIFYNDKWGTVCDDSFDDKDAAVICRNLGLNSLNAIAYGGSYYGRGNGSIIIDELECNGYEPDVSHCRSKPWLSHTNCDHDEDAGVDCLVTVTPIRLIGGCKAFVGRVEVFFRYLPLHFLPSMLWIPLCYDGFTQADARVICRMLGHPQNYPSTLGAYNFHDVFLYGYGLFNLSCRGSEDDISDCLAGDVSIDKRCYLVGINCDPITPIRLVDGPSLRAGRVELMFNNTWGSVCDMYLSSQKRNVLCRMLGHNNGSLSLPSSYFSTGTGPYIVSNLYCLGSEFDVSNCKSDAWVLTSNCSSNAGLACKTPVRLVNGSYSRSGRVEVYHNGSWGSICAESFDLDVANVICRGVGFRFWNASVLAGSKFGEGSRNFLNNLTCSGDEIDVSLCRGGPWAATTCKEGAAAVDCSSLVTPVRLVNTSITPYSGDVQVYYNNRWGTISYSGITKQTVDVLCLNLGYNVSRDASWTTGYNSSCHMYMVTGLRCHGDESDISECPSDDWDTSYVCGYSLKINCLTTISLHDGRTSTMGRIHVRHGYRDGLICDEDFTEENARVVCSMLGYNFTRYPQVRRDVFNNPTSLPIIITGLKCIGNEKDINLCPSDPWGFYSNCSNNRSVGINCNTPVRMTDHQYPRTGIVQVMINGTFARICSNSSLQQSYNVGGVVCRELGYYSGSVKTFADTIRDIDEKTYTIVCDGSEADISFCHTEESTCPIGTLLGISCDTPLGLVHGRTEFMGKVILTLSETGVISSSGLNETDANYVCSLLGHNFTRNAMLQSSEDIRFNPNLSNLYTRTVVDHLHCIGNESDISDCIHNFENWQKMDTQSYTNLKINCQTPLRVVSGQPYIYGEVQIFSNNTWMPVCADAFTKQDAYVVCRMMGHYHVRHATLHQVINGDNHTQQYLTAGFHCTGDEEDLSECKNLSWSTKQCDKRIRIDCGSPARIVDGPTPYEGLIELFVNNTWWPVCYSFSKISATVLCRTAGFTETYVQISPVPLSSQFIALHLFSQCFGSEQTISECFSSGWSEQNCGALAYISCHIQTEIQNRTGSNKYNGFVRIAPFRTLRYICAESFDEDDAKVICRRLGFQANSSQVKASYSTVISGNESFEDLQCVGNELDVQACNHSNWKISQSSCNIAAVNCQPVTPVRLVDGPNNASGRIEVFYDGQWGTVCDDSFDDRDVSVFCEMLGYNSGVMNTENNPGSGPIWIDNVACTGSEGDVSECPSQYWGEHNCQHSEDVAIECSDRRVKLINGRNMYRGHVEIEYLRQWYTVCSDHMDHNDTDVICRELGVINQPKARIYEAGVIPQSNNGARWIKDLMCNGSEHVVDDCSSFPWTSSTPYCLQRSVAINCRPHTPIRLVGGPNKYSGRLEVEYPTGNWSTICDYGFDELDAQVICRSLGFNDKSVGVKLRSYYGYQSLSASISHLYCSSDESDISDCNVGYEWGRPYANCDSTRQAGVQCNTPLRLSGGRTKYSGLLEVYYQKAWGTVCGEGFDIHDAQTVCNILGLTDQYNGSIFVNEGTHYGESQGNVLLHNLNCTGEEDDLHECGTLHWMNNSCSHDQDVTLNCRATTELRLMNGDIEVAFDSKEAERVEGRVEVFYDGQWGTICNDHFDDDDAFVLCSMKGYNAGIYRNNINEFGPGRGPITVDDLFCFGDEPDVSECVSREWNVHDCEHDEDVAIECYFKEENQDPCSNFNHQPLPHLEFRYVNYNTEGQRPVYNDSGLVRRWYNVGREVMPNFAPKMHSCGTTHPVYLIGSVPVDKEDQVDRVACQVTSYSDCGHTYNISIKLCQNNTYVYKLGPTVDEYSGYCFGIGTLDQAPEFVPIDLNIASIPENYSFRCEFLESEADLYYSVVWQIQGDQNLSLTKGYCNRSNRTLLDLTEEDLVKNTVKMGFKLICSARAYTVPGGPPGRLSDPSPPYFAGIQILTPSINMLRGETKAIEFKLTVPLSCEHAGCSLDIMIFSSAYGHCNNIGFISGRCGLSLKQNNANHIQQLNITSAETGQYGVSGNFQVFLQTTRESNVKSIWTNIILPFIEVKISPEADTTWRGRLCAARNDPHMYTFDGRQYEHHVKGNVHPENTKGTFILYKNIKYGNDVEIQHRVTPCSTTDNSAMCNCGVAVRAGRDVYVISVCDSLIDIGYKHCSDNSLTVKKEDDMTYTVYLPYGTAMQARIDIQPWMGPEGGMALDINVTPSLYDQEGNSRGLCGTLDGDPSNDFHYTDANGHIINLEDEIDFINRWKVNETESMFSPNVEKVNYNNWLFPLCVCNNEESSVQNILPCKSSTQTCTSGVSTGSQGCFEVSSRSVHSLRKIPLIPVIPIARNLIAKSRTKRSTDPVNSWTDESATEYCNEFFSKSNAYTKCQRVPFTHTKVSLDNCVLDIRLSNSTDWSKLTLQSMQDSCMSTVMKNATVRQEVAENVTAGENGTDVSDPVHNIIDDIIKEFAVSCKLNCNGNGKCNKGTCDCNNGFGGSDCSVNTTEPPKLVGVQDHGLCDKVNKGCDFIVGIGFPFLDKNLTCRLTKSVIDRNGNEQLTASLITDGRAESLAMVICPVSTNPQSIYDGPASKNSHMDDSSFVVAYNVSVSNTGAYSAEQRVFVYDSTCQTYLKSPEVTRFILKNGTCYIDRRCYMSEETHPDDIFRVCNPSLSDSQWTVLTTTTFDKTTIRQTRLEMKLNYDPGNDNLNNANTSAIYVKEARKSLTERYKLWFAEGDFIEVSVSSVRRGSLIIEHTLYTAKNADNQLIRLIAGGAGSLKTLTFFQQLVEVQIIKVIKDEEDQVCVIFSIIYKCPCEVVQGRPQCINPVTEIPPNDPALMISVTSGLVFIIVVTLLVFICKRRAVMRKRKANDTATQSGYEYLTPTPNRTSSQYAGVYSLGSQGSSSSTYSDEGSLNSSRLPRLVSDGTRVTARTDFYRIPGNRDNVFYGIR